MGKEEWLKGVFNTESENEYVGVLHIRPELNDWLKSGEPVLFGEYAMQWLDVFAKPQLAGTSYFGYRNQMNKHMTKKYGGNVYEAMNGSQLYQIEEKQIVRIVLERKP